MDYKEEYGLREYKISELLNPLTQLDKIVEVPAENAVSEYRIYKFFMFILTEIQELLTDWVMLYNTIILVLAIMAQFSPWIYCIMLLDIITKSDTIRNVSKAAILRYDQIAITMIFGFFLLFI